MLRGQKASPILTYSNQPWNLACRPCSPCRDHKKSLPVEARGEDLIHLAYRLPYTKELVFGVRQRVIEKISRPVYRSGHWPRTMGSTPGRESLGMIPSQVRDLFGRLWTCLGIRGL